MLDQPASKLESYWGATLSTEQPTPLFEQGDHAIYWLGITDETAVGQAVAIGELLGFAAVAAEESRRQWPEAWSGARRKSLRSWLT